MTDISRRLAAASGAFSFLALFVGNDLMGNGGGTVARVGYGLTALGFTAFVVFLGFFHTVLREAEGPADWLATVAFSAGLLHAAVRFAAQAPRMVGTYRDGSLSTELARTLTDLNDMAFVVSGLLLGVYCAAAGGVCLSHRLTPRWLGWFGTVSGVLAAVAGVIGMTDPRSYVPLAFLASLLWTLAVSVLLAVRPQRRSSVSGAPAFAPAQA